MMSAPTPRLQDYIAITVSTVALVAIVFVVSLNQQVPSAGIIGTSMVEESSMTHSFVHTSTSDSKPNIVFILADDMGYNGIGDLNSDDSFGEGQTDFGKALTELSPTLTSLAQSGVVITNYYSQEVCTPSRAAFLTGRYPVHLGMQFGVVETYTPWALDLNETTLAEVLQSEGYDTYAFGKWHLGHHTQRYLPTARGFDEFVGYLNGDNYYYSKTCPNQQLYYDFTMSNSTCYQKSTDTAAFSTYSTNYYKQLAIDVIESHANNGDDDSGKNPFFLYVAMQAVHAPFYDNSEAGDYESLTFDLTANKTWVASIVSDISGAKSKMYALTLNVLDDAVADIMTSLSDNNLMSNTYVIFASDNGGCYLNGGKNSPYRGSKASLFEGGTKVDAFIYSPDLLVTDDDYSLSGTSYSTIFHVSDWFPTILDMAGITYTPPAGYELSGVSHLAYMMGTTEVVPRNFLLYNAYVKVMNADGTYDFDPYTDGVFAIRNDQYKLIHSYNGSDLVTYYNGDEVYNDDEDLSNNVDCKQQSIYEGHYQMYLFDLTNDPFETTNLYDSTDDDIVTIKELLYEQLSIELAAAAQDWTNVWSNEFDEYCQVEALKTWSSRDMTIGPFLPVTWDKDFADSSKSYPEYCGPGSSDDDDVDDDK